MKTALKIITPDDVRESVKALSAVIQRDPGAAHSQEDALHLEVLKAISEDRCRQPRVCAALAASTEDIEFPRWCG